MKEIVVKSQSELDALPIDFDGRIIVKFGTRYNRAVINRRFLYSVEAWGNSSVVARENSSVVAWGNSSVEAWGNSSVEARENSSVVARENSSVVAWENSSVVAWENSSVVASGNSQICDCTNSHKITTAANSRIVYNPRNIDEYCDHHQIDNDETTAKLYKAVHKREGRYFSDNDSSFEYVIGGVAVADGLTTDTTEDCGHGIHMAHKAWCVDYGRDWKDLAIIEVEAEKSGIVVPVPGCGKVRAAQVKVLREIPLEECGLIGKIIAKKKG